MKIFVRLFILTSILLAPSANTFAQSLEESCALIATEISNGSYSNFAVSGSGSLTYTWSDKQGSETILSVDLFKAVFSKEEIGQNRRVWIRCVDGTNCITEKGIVGTDKNYYATFNKTYLPADSSKGVDIIHKQLSYLYKLIFGVK